MEEKYIINSKDKLYTLFGELKLYVIIELFFTELNNKIQPIKIQPIKIQKYMTISEIPEKLSDIYILNNNILNLYKNFEEYNLNISNKIYKNYIDISIIIFEESTENKVKLCYNSKIVP